MTRNTQTTRQLRRVATMCVGMLLVATVAPTAPAAADPVKAKGADAAKQEVFESPEAAAEALLLAFKSNDDKTLLDLFGHDHEKLIVVTDKVARADALAELLEAAEEKQALEKEGESKCTLVLGRQNWPFPIPLVRTTTMFRAGITRISCSPLPLAA